MCELGKELLLIGKMRIANTLLKCLHILRMITIQTIHLFKGVWHL